MRLKQEYEKQQIEEELNKIKNKGKYYDELFNEVYDDPEKSNLKKIKYLACSLNRRRKNRPDCKFIRIILKNSLFL